MGDEGVSGILLRNGMTTSQSMAGKRWRLAAVVAVLLCVCVGLLAVPPIGRLFHPIKLKLLGRYTVEQRIEQYGDGARNRLLPAFDKAGVSYPPAVVTLVGFKQERLLEVYAGDSASTLRHIVSYPIFGASGELGPKLAEGDRQVPEGIYGVESLNPNSRFHLSIKVDYPNAFDREMAEVDGRTNLGDDIFIHGGSASVGCLAMGDDVAEELFVLLAETGIEGVRVVIAPVDMRSHDLPVSVEVDGWRGELYTDIQGALDGLGVTR